MSAPVVETPTVMEGAVLLDRRRPGRLVQVWGVSPKYVRVITVDAWGCKNQGARLRPVPAADLEARFHLYRPCRWMLDCLAQATVTIGHYTGDVDACTKHAAEYQKWLESIEGVMHANWDPEPEPECWCPDDVTTHETLGPVKYCPQHGTPQRRGTNLGELVLPSGGAGPVLVGPDRGQFPNSGPYLEDE